ncbi:MAG TPA: hypothetical protein VFN23_01215, partial [Ktedonobacteraceae bacterium]|nr:hypothetical protein [Ktedonobacteraceae bacterium]
VLANVSDNVQSGFETTQDVVSKNAKMLRKQAKKAQKQFVPLIADAADSVQSGLETTQKTVSKNAKKAGKTLKSAADNIKDTQESVQDQLEKYSRRRKRNRFLFRVGLVGGVVVALLYAPQTGAEVRQKLMDLWNQYVPQNPNL